MVNFKGFLSLIFPQMLKILGVIVLISYSNHTFSKVIFFLSFKLILYTWSRTTSDTRTTVWEPLGYGNLHLVLQFRNLASATVSKPSF